MRREGEANPASGRLPAFISVDCLSQIDYFRACGISPRSDFTDQVYRRGIPRLLNLFARVGARATFFVVGREASKPQNRTVLSRIVAEGHEVANHTLTHPTNFVRYGSAAKAYEIDGAHRAIAEATGVEPVGFRAPLFYVDRMTLDLLEERGYLYDSSVFPGLRYGAVGFKSINRPRRSVCGIPLSCFAPKGPYRPDVNALWRRGGRPIWEIPVTTVPGLKTPFSNHFLLRAGMGYFRAAFWAVAKWAPCLVFQCRPMELMAVGEDGVDPRLKRMSVLDRPIAEKEGLMKLFLERMGEVYEFLPGREFLKVRGNVKEGG